VQQQKKRQKNEKILSERDIPCEELKIHYDRFAFERDHLAFEYLPLDLDELLQMPIYLINFQVFCKVDEEDGGQYIPAELCILQYTLAEGVRHYFHTFIKPEKIPAGYMSACLEHSKSTHEIPLKDFAEATDNYRGIFQEIKSILFGKYRGESMDDQDRMPPADDRIRRRDERRRRPCLFFPAVEFEQTNRLFDWLQEKAEGISPTKETRHVSFASIESLIMLLAELKKQRVSRDDIHKTFENAAYSFMIDDRCNFHSHLGISHCSVARCHAAAKLISAYLNQLYIPSRPSTSTSVSIHQRPQSSAMNKSDRSSVLSNSSAMGQREPKPVVLRPPTITQPVISSQYSSTGTSDSIASSYRAAPTAPAAAAPTTNEPMRSIRTSLSSNRSASTYPYQTEERDAATTGQISDDLINHPTIMKLQQQNFHRLLSSAASSASSSSSIVKPSTSFSSRLNKIDRTTPKNYSNQSTPVPQDQTNHNKSMSDDNQRAVLQQRKLALMQAIQNINQQMEELNMQ